MARMGQIMNSPCDPMVTTHVVGLITAEKEVRICEKIDPILESF